MGSRKRPKDWPDHLSGLSIDCSSAAEEATEKGDAESGEEEVGPERGGKGRNDKDGWLDHENAVGWPKAPESGRLDEATDEESSSSKSGRLISATGGSTNGDLDRGSDPVSFSKARRLDFSLCFSASAPRPDGSNLSLWLFNPVNLDDFGSPLGEVGEAGESKDGECRMLRELGRETAFWSLMFGKEMEFERV